MLKPGKGIFRVTSLLILWWALLFSPGQRVRADRIESFDALFPADTLLYCSIQNLPEFHLSWQASPLAALVKDQVLSDVLRKAGVDQWMRSRLPLAYRVQIPLKDMIRTFPRRAAVALVSTNPSRASIKNIQLLLLADYKGPQASVESLINTCLPGLEGVSRKGSIVNGVTVYSCNYVLTEPVSIPEVNTKKGKSTGSGATVPAESASSPATVLKEYRYPVAYAFHDSVFLFGLGTDAALKAVLKDWQTPSASSLAQKSTYQALAANNRKSADLFLYINAGLGFQLLEDEVGSQHGSASSGGLDLRSLGLSEFQEAGVWLELKAQGLAIVQEILLSRRESSTSGLLFPQMVNSFRSLGLTPPDAIVYRSSVWDCAAQWRTLKKILRASWPEAFARLSDLEQSLDAQFGFSLEQELLSVVRGECARYVRRGSDKGQPFYSRTYIIDVSDAAQMQRCMEKMLETMKSLGLIQYQRDMYLGHTVFVIRPFNITSSTHPWGLACLPSFCVASSSIDEVRELIRRMNAKTGQSLAQNAEIQPLRSRHPRNALRLSYRVYEQQAQQSQTILVWLKPLLSKTAASIVQAFELAYVVNHQVLPRYFQKVISLWSVTKKSARGEINILYRSP